MSICFIIIASACHAKEPAAKKAFVRAKLSSNSPLATYLSKPEPSYSWTKTANREIDGVDLIAATLTSQKWRGAEWKHRLYIVRPHSQKVSRQAVIMIGGGQWSETFASPTDAQLPKDFMRISELSKKLEAPVVLLMDVPHQPLFGGLVEDEIIAKTFSDFFKSGNAEDIALLPMVKSVVQGMNAAQEIASASWSLEIDRFVVTGASKRGWTTWLVGAVDKRVSSIAPAAIDMLNMPVQRKHQLAVWGKFSEEISDYKREGVLDQLDTPRGQELVNVVDPFVYRDVLLVPKLIILGTNDRYWTLDALNQYWSGLKGPKNVLYLPNCAHDLNDPTRVNIALAAFCECTENGKLLPEFTWEFKKNPSGIALIVRSKSKPQAVRAWTASSSTRDFRDSPWITSEMTRTQDLYKFDLAANNDMNQAIFAELVFDWGGQELCLSTTLEMLTRSDRDQSTND